jgi:hypothetical protein
MAGEPKSHKRVQPVRAPLRERTGCSGNRIFDSPARAVRLIYLAGDPFTDTPRQGALGGLTPLHNEPAAHGCYVEDGDDYQREDRDLIELVAESGLSDRGPALRAINRREPFVIERRSHRHSFSFIRSN